MEPKLPATLTLPIHFRVLSWTPGRIRVRLGEEWRDPVIMAQIVQTLSELVSQIQRIKANPQTGSLTLYLDPTDGSGEEWVRTLETMGIIATAQDQTPATSASQHLTGLMGSWNQRVNQWTDGTADLRFLVPLIFAILAFRRILTNGGGLRSAPWYILAWYAFDSFIKLNPSLEHPSEPTAPPPSAVDVPKLAASVQGEASEPDPSDNHKRSPKSKIQRSNPAAPD